MCDRRGEVRVVEAEPLPQRCEGTEGVWVLPRVCEGMGAAGPERGLCGHGPPGKRCFGFPQSPRLCSACFPESLGSLAARTGDWGSPQRLLVGKGEL